MKNIFILSNSFTERTILYHLDYIFDFSINHVFILKENHDITEEFDSNNIKVIISDDINECVLNSDIIFILKNDNIPKKTIKIVETLVKNLKKEIICIANPWYEDIADENILNENIKYNNVPVILQIFVGQFTQNYCTEILLNKILSNKNVKFIQEFSKETESLIKQLKIYNILNNNILKCKESKSEEYNVVVKSLHINNIYDLQKDKKLFEIISYLAPNYVIINTHFNFNIDEKIYDLFIYKYNINLNTIIKSQYLLDQQNERATYCNKDIYFRKSHKNIYSINSKNLEKNLVLDLFSKIALPKDVFII